MTARSTATGWEPVVGQLVVQRMWSPMHPSWSAPLEERQRAGQRYGEDQVMRLAGIVPDYDVHAYRRSLGADLEPRLETRWWLVDPDRPGAEHLMSWVEDSWCELLPVELEQSVTVALW